MNLLKKKNEQDTAGGSASVKQGFGWKGYLLYYLSYTLLFGVMAAAVFVWLFLKKRRLVWQTDGVNQHYYGLVFFSRWGKEVLRNLRETGSLQLPTFTLRMGYGGDLFTTLAYYVIGDPFSLPAVFVPEKYLLHYHDLMLLVRFWLAGITFSAYNFYMGRKNRIAVLAGALVYIFNGFTMSGMRHHYFLNPFVFFPLLLIGCEWYFRKKKPWLFILMVFVTAVSNFYFFYMMVIMTALYAVWRAVRLHGLRHFGAVILDGIAFVWYGLIGTLLASFIFLPIVLRFLQDPRTADSKQIPLLWPVSYYRNFIDCFLTNGTSALAESWTYMGFGAVALLCVLFVFVRVKKHFDLKAAFVVLTALLLTPLAGYVMNGFSYPANRWMFAYALLIGTMTATAIPELAEAGRKELLAVFVLLLLVVGVCVGWEYTFSRASAQAVILGVSALAAVLLGRTALLEKERELPAEEAGSGSGRIRRNISVRVQAAILACVMLTIASAAYFDFAPGRSAKVFEYLSRAQIETYMEKDASAASRLIDGQLLKEEADRKGKVPFYRYTAYNPENNTSILYGVSNTQYYWSLSDPSVSQFLNETGQLNRMIHLYDTLDDRTALNEIAGIRYFLGNDADGVPYGYEKKKGLSFTNADLWPDNKDLERFSCEVYENKYALPFGFTSGKWISRQDYDAMDIPQRQQALLQGILLEKDPGEEFIRMTSASKDAAGAAKADGSSIAFTDRRIPVQIEYAGKTVNAGNSGKIKFAAAQGGETVTVRFEGMQNCETALYVRGMHYAPPAGQKGTTKMLVPVTGFAGDKQAASKQIGYTTPDDPWTTGRKDFYVNMIYRAEALDHIDLVLPAQGTYTFDSIEVVCQPMEAYVEQAEALRTSPLTDLDIHEMGSSLATDRISGHIELTSPQILCLQIPRTAGWTAYVDGRRAELLQADTMFSALLLSEGSHDIELTYQTPGLRLGAVVSLGTVVLFILFLLLYGIISAILRGRGKRREEIPVGTYEQVGRTEAAVIPEEAAEPAEKETAALPEETAEEEAEEAEEQAEVMAAGDPGLLSEETGDREEEEKPENMTGLQTSGAEQEAEETGTEE